MRFDDDEIDSTREYLARITSLEAEVGDYVIRNMKLDVERVALKREVATLHATIRRRDKTIARLKQG